MAGLGDQAFGIEIAVAERGLGLGCGAREGVRYVALGGHDAHASPAAARDRLDDDARLAMLGEERLHPRQVGRAVCTRQHRRPVLAGMGPGTSLVAEQLELFRCRADEDQAAVGTGARQGSILGQEAVAGMETVASRCAGGRNHARDIEIGRRAAPAERPDLIDSPDMQGGRVVLGMDTDCGDAEFGGGLGDADGDFAAIGDQEFLEHGTDYRGKIDLCRNAC